MIPSIETLIEKLNRLTGSTDRHGNFHLTYGAANASEAKALKKHLVQLQRSLRGLKRESNAAMKAIRSEYTGRKSQVESPFMQILAGKKAAGQRNAQKKEALRREQQAKVAPYAAFNAIIDDLILQIDAGKTNLDGYVAETKLEDLKNAGNAYLSESPFSNAPLPIPTAQFVGPTHAETPPTAKSPVNSSLIAILICALALCCGGPVFVNVLMSARSPNGTRTTAPHNASVSPNSQLPVAVPSTQGITSSPASQTTTPTKSGSNRPPEKQSTNVVEPVSSMSLRGWKDDAGTHTIIAEFVEYKGGVVTLKKESGERVSVPITKLSEIDQAWVYARFE